MCLTKSLELILRAYAGVTSNRNVNIIINELLVTTTAVAWIRRSYKTDCYKNSGWSSMSHQEVQFMLVMTFLGKSPENFLSLTGGCFLRDNGLRTFVLGHFGTFLSQTHRLIFNLKQSKLNLRWGIDFSEQLVRTSFAEACSMAESSGSTLTIVASGCDLFMATFSSFCALQRKIWTYQFKVIHWYVQCRCAQNLV